MAFQKFVELFTETLILKEIKVIEITSIRKFNYFDKKLIVLFPLQKKPPLTGRLIFQNL